MKYYMNYLLHDNEHSYISKNKCSANSHMNMYILSSCYQSMGADDLWSERLVRVHQTYGEHLEQRTNASML